MSNSKPTAYVLDSWSVVAYFSEEEAGNRVAQLLADAHEQSIPVWMSIINVGETWYAIARKEGEREADERIAELRSVDVRFSVPDWTLTRQAALFKSKHKLSFADAFAAALAKQRNASLVTGDPEFKQLEHEIAILWLTPKAKKKS